MVSVVNHVMLFKELSKVPEAVNRNPQIPSVAEKDQEEHMIVKTMRDQWFLFWFDQ